MSIFKSSVKLASSQGIMSVINFLALAFFAKELGAHVLGMFFLFQSVNGIVKLVSNFGMRAAMEKQISGQQNPEDVLASAIVLRGFLLVPFLVTILLFRTHINSYLGAGLALLLVVAIVADEAGQFLVSVLKGEIRVGDTAVLQVIQQLCWVVFGVILMFAGLEVRALIYAGIIGSLLKTLRGVYMISITPGNISWERIRDLLVLGKDFLVPAMNNHLYSWMDVLILGFFVTQSSIAGYEIAWRVGGIIVIFSKALASSLLPQISLWDANSNHDQIAATVPKALTASSLLVIPSFVGVTVLAEHILRYVFSPEYVFATVVLVILAAGKVVESTNLVIGPTLRGIGQADLSTRAAVAGGITNAVLNVVLIWQFGIIGAAVATASSISITTLLHYHYLRQYVTFQYPLGEIGWLTGSAVFMGVIVILFAQQFGINSIFHLVSAICIGIGTYFVATFVHPPLRRRIQTNIQQIVPI